MRALMVVKVGIFGIGAAVCGLELYASVKAISDADADAQESWSCAVCSGS
jgi:hypothetical protein